MSICWQPDDEILKILAEILAVHLKEWHKVVSEDRVVTEESRKCWENTFAMYFTHISCLFMSQILALVLSETGHANGVFVNRCQFEIMFYAELLGTGSILTKV